MLLNPTNKKKWNKNIPKSPSVVIKNAVHIPKRKYKAKKSSKNVYPETLRWAYL